MWEREKKSGAGPKLKMAAEGPVNEHFEKDRDLINCYILASPYYNI